MNASDRRGVASGRLRGLLDFLRYVAVCFMRDRCLPTAAALAYTSLLALVPLLTVLFITLSAFPAFQDWRAAIEAFVFENFVPALGDQVRAYLLEFADKARGLRAAGIIVLLATVLTMMSTIESTFNVIWGVRRQRPLMVRFLVYWAVLTLGPVLIGAGMVATSYIVSLPLLGGEVADGLRTRVIAWSPLAATTLAFVLFYQLIPFRPVPVRHALAGGVVASVLFEIAKGGFAFYVAHFPGQQAIYGAFATLPVFLLWIYLSWVVVLLGAEITQCLTTFRANWVPRPADLRGEDRLLCAYRVLFRLWEAQRAGQPLSDKALMRHEPRFGFGVINRVLATLDRAGWICRDEDFRWMLLRDLHQVTLYDLLTLVPCFTPPAALHPADADAADSALRAPLAGLGDFARERLALPLAGLFEQTGLPSVTAPERRITA